MFKDLDIIKQLEQEIGENLDPIDLEAIAHCNSEIRKNGYTTDENENIIGLNLDQLELYSFTNTPDVKSK